MTLFYRDPGRRSNTVRSNTSEEIEKLELLATEPNYAERTKSMIKRGDNLSSDSMDLSRKELKEKYDIPNQIQIKGFRD